MFDWFKKKPPDNAKSPVGPDFLNVDKKTAQRLVKEGKLEKVMLLPEMFGGEDIEHNILYVPIGIAAVKNEIDENVIRKLAREGKVTQYEARPQYQGDSFVPSRIDIRAHNPGEFTTQIKIWGESSPVEST